MQLQPQLLPVLLHGRHWIDGRQYSVVETHHSRPYGYPLRTGPDGKRCILNIGADDVLAGLGEYACADAEFGVWAC